MSYSAKVTDDRSSRRSVSVVLAMLALIAGLAAFNWLSNRGKSVPTSAELAVLSGRATVTRADAGTDPPLQAGQTTTIQRGDEVCTGSEAKATLTFSAEESAELGSGTRLTILDLHQSPFSRALVVILALHEGETLTRIRHTLFRGMEFRIETRVVTVEARGTIFQCNVVDKSHVYVAVHDGVVNVSMGEQSVDLQAGEGLHARLGQSLTPVPVARPLSLDVPEGGEPVSGPGPSLQDREKTLFPPIVTPTRPGDGVGALEAYTVRERDTLYSISRRFGVSWQAIWEANKDVLSSPELLRPGQRLRIPKP